ncbi:MAG TPA: hypothetical protein VE325_00975 [Burkholderiales bacterium]|jgi:hypothetical protein|nr:hypothetical protein [Burkholderiales bacterium]
MKITLALLAAASAALAGCVAVPVEPGPVYAAPPPPVVVVRPYGYYGGYYYRGGGPYWRRWR